MVGDEGGDWEVRGQGECKLWSQEIDLFDVGEEFMAFWVEGAGGRKGLLDQRRSRRGRGRWRDGRR